MNFNNKKNYLRFSLFTLFIFLLLLSSMAKGKGVKIKWKKVPRAGGYRIVIKNLNNNIVLNRDTGQTFLTFILPSGEYQAQIRVLNKFKKVSVRSKWFKIIIKKSIIPIFTSISQSRFKTGKGPVDVSITGDAFNSDCRISFNKDGETITAEKIIVESGQSISATIDPSKFSDGDYDLIITNPGHKPTVTEKQIHISSDPIFLSMKPVEFTNNEIESDITILGEKFKENCSVSIEIEGKVFTPKKIERQSDKKIAITIDPSKMKEGRYDLVISNGDDSFVKINSALTISPRIYRKTHGIYVGLSPVLNLVLPDWNKLIKGSFKGCNIYGGYDLPYFNDIPVVKDMGVELNLDFISYTNDVSEDENTASLTNFIFSCGIFYKNNFSLPVDFLFHTGGGLAYSAIGTTDSDGSTEYTSYDPYFYFGLSARYLFLDYTFMELGSDIQNILYINSTLSAIHIYLRIGIVF